jgi:Carboxypeptidase regulatory-like domain/TonB dependent receptor/TonB-dependent Receptor Plug Domain
MKNFSIKVHLLTVSIIVVLSSFVFGQQNTGQINGTVKDQNGAVINGASVKVKNTETNAERSSTTNGDGYFVVTNLLPGQYEITVNQTGFAAKSVKTNVSVGGASSVNIDLGITAAATVDIVSTGIAEVNTTDQQQSTVVTDKQIQNLPILNNNPYSLVLLAPNVSTNDPSGRGTGVAINGQRGASTNILLDGTENSNTFTATIAQNVPQDAVSEFRIITNTFGAEYGRASGGIVNVSTKSGTNQIRGTGFAQNRNSALASAGYNTNARGLPRAQFNRNQDGFTIGGPIIKNKLFFFNSLQSTIIRSTATSLAWVPSARYINAAPANIKAFFTAYGTLKATRTGVTQNLSSDGSIPDAVFNEVSYKTNVDAGGGTPENGFQNVAKIDWNFSDRTQFYASWKVDRDNFASGTAANSPYKNYDASSKTFSQNFQGSVVHSFSSNLIMDAKLAYRRSTDTVTLESSAATPTLYFQGIGSSAGGTGIALPGYNPFAPGSGLPTFGTEQLWDFKPNVTWIKGNHILKFGGQYVYLQDQRRFGAYEGASYNLGTGGDLQTGLANFLTGIATIQVAVDPQGKTPGGTLTLPVKSPNFNRTNQYHEYAGYVTDGWKVTSGLNLNIGVRYEYFGPQKSKEGLDSNFNLGSGSNIFQQIRNGSVKVSSTVGGLWKKDRNNWSPKLGFAWDITGDGKTSLRGGYGIGFERNFGNVTFNVIQNPPFYAVQSNLEPVSISNFGSLAGTSGTAPLRRSSLRYVDENIVTAYAHQWGLSLEREIAKSTTLKIDYSGSAGRDQYTLENINRVGTGTKYLGTTNVSTCPTGLVSNGNNDRRLNCAYTNINTRSNKGTNNNYSFSASLESNNLLGTGLITTFRYTNSVNKDNLSSTFSESGNNFNLGLLDPFNPNLDYGYSDYDTRHRFVSSIIYPVPFKFDNKGVNAVLGGWVASTILSIESGAPFTIFDCTSASFTVCQRLSNGNGLTFNGTRVDTGAANTFNFIDLSKVTPSQFSDGFSFGVEVGTPANMQRRNSYRRPGQWYVDMGLSKEITFAERYKLQFRADAFNVFNHANLFIDGNADVSNALTFDPVTGDINGTKAFVRAFKAGARTAQVGVRLSF